MFSKSESFSRLMEMEFCSCFGFIKEPPPKPLDSSSSFFSDNDDEIDNRSFYQNTPSESFRRKSIEEIYSLREETGFICREVPVKVTRELIRTYDDEDGSKMVNEYVRQWKIGCGSYGKVVLYISRKDGNEYAIKVFHKSYLLKLRVTPTQTAMDDVLREVLIMKMLSHPNIVNLVEVIDDPSKDQFYMVLEYVQGKCVFEGSQGGVEDLSTARKYLRDIVAGLMYLHEHNVVHGDIKPENLLVTSSRTVKIGDFSVSQVFEDDDDELRRSPGTPVFTAPECCLGVTHRGKAADTWALGVTLYWMVLGQYPFFGDSLEDTYDKIVNDTVSIPEGINPHLKDLLEGLLCKDPIHRMTLNVVAEHPWVIDEEGPIPQYSCCCKQRNIRARTKEINGCLHG